MIFESQFLHDVYLVKHLLEEQNIVTYIRNENVTATIGVSMLERHKLMVDEKDAVRALQLIKENDIKKEES